MSMELAMWLFGACGAAILGTLGFAWTCYNKANADLAKLRDDCATTVGKNREEFYAYKVHVAEHFSTIAATVLMEKRMVDGLEDVKKALNDQSKKIDRLIERRPGSTHD